MAASSVLGRRQESAAEQRVVVGPVAFSGFPVRGLTKRVSGDGGEWVRAYQAEQRTRLKAVLSPSVRAQGGRGSGLLLRPPTNTREASGLPRHLRSLDEPFLLKHCYVEAPSDLCVCNISGAGLEAVKSEDIAKFDSVVCINASDNHLPLEAFVRFPILNSLELSLNSIVDVTIGLEDFTTLQTLDLSYNSLSGLSLLALGVLPALKELRLTGNNLVALPVDMSRLYSVASDSENSTRVRYPVLEKLWLDDNKLTDQTTFATLAGLRRLKYLNLDDNEIYTVPELKLLASGSIPSHTQHTGDTGTPTAEDNTQAALDTVKHTVNPSQAERKEQSDRGSTPSPLHTITTRPLSVQSHTSASQRNPLLSRLADAHMYSRPPPLHSTTAAVVPHSPGLSGASCGGQPQLEESHGGELRLVRDESNEASFAPFPKLETLSLVNNLILMSEGVLACGSWPVLKQLIIHGNPLTRTCKGMPPPLQTHLVEQCGVNVIRKKPVAMKQHSIGSTAKDFKKVSSAPPPFIPRQLLPAIEAPPTLDHMMLEFSPSPPHSFATSPSDSHLSSEDGEGEEQQENIFMTQVTGEEKEPDGPAIITESPKPSSDEQQWSGSATFKAHLSEVRARFSHAPQRYRGYEALLDTYNDPTMRIPADAHSCTRALQYALKHPRVLPDTAQHSTHTVHAGASYLKKKSPSPLQPLVPSQHHPSTKVRELQVVLDEIRTQCNTLETNLAEVLKPTPPSEQRTASRLQRENRKLLLEMQARYDQVRTSSLQKLRSATEFETGSAARSKKPAQRAVRFSEILT